ncbi:MAG: Phosphoribosylaminoimidazole-succinocarboxamide synthase [Syntrophomonadaceae bacterium]|nr:Phosphoribosylaminoimidazole-succinocarboxamide synthase [Bacillota bacterium]
MTGVKKNTVLLTLRLPDIKMLKQGKVRDIYDLGNKLLIVATDRISAFDVVLPDGIPDKGKVLTGLSVFWFGLTKEIISNHLITAESALFPERLQEHAEVLNGRVMLVQKADVIPIECVVRGYLAGSAWKEYQETGSVCGVKLPYGLLRGAPIPEPIFTPATKATWGHDINISEKEAGELVGHKLIQELKAKSLKIYSMASRYAEHRGIIIADTKLEFGRIDNKTILIDELLTPDSSRFWPYEDLFPKLPDEALPQADRTQRSFDKQFVRDYLEMVNWDKAQPPPHLPPEIIAKTSEKYHEAYLRLTGRRCN